MGTPSGSGGFVAMLILSFVFTARGGTKVLTTDPLTGLALYPATDSRLRLGNEPTQLPESQVCKSKMQVDLYSVYDSKVNATLAWYDAHLPGFKKTPPMPPIARKILSTTLTGSWLFLSREVRAKQARTPKLIRWSTLALARPSGESDYQPNQQKVICQ